MVTHMNIMPLFDIFVSAEGRDLGGVLSDVEKAAKAMEHELPRGASLEIHGQAEAMHGAYIELVGGLVAAIVFIYLLIVVNFQSWLDPFIIITALPGALAGIAWSLFLTRTNLSVPALTGAIMCMGTATANSILVVSYARERLLWHADAMLAALEAGYARIRPVHHDRRRHDHRDGSDVDGEFAKRSPGKSCYWRAHRCDLRNLVLRPLRLHDGLQA